MNITQPLQEWGNGAGVRISKKIREAAHIEVGQELKIDVRGRSIVLTPVKTDDFTLSDMLKGVTPENVHGELDWGTDVGAEVIND